jgi:undecaprenyl-diphosphatase
VGGEILAFLERLPNPAVYGLLAFGAALENLVPPIPADTFVLLGGFLAGRGRLSSVTVFVLTWVANVGSALAVYWIGRVHGRVFFEEGAGRHVLRPRQLRRMRRFYRRWGTPAIFLARFLPGLRAVVPGFAGVSGHPFWPLAIPLAAASAIWYGALVVVGVKAGRNLPAVLAFLSATNLVLVLVAVACATVLVIWWRRGRGGRREPD